MASTSSRQAYRMCCAPRVERLGYLDEFFQCTGTQPDVLLPFMEMTGALKKALPDRLTETGALTVATLMGNDYERNQHERLSRKLDFGEDWVAAVEEVSPDSASFVAVGNDVTILARGAEALARVFSPASEKPFVGSGGIY